MKQLILLFAILVGVMFVAAELSKPDSRLTEFLNLSTNNKQETTEEQSQKDNQKFVKIEGKAQVVVEIADTENERSQGLTIKDSLTENQGMLFVFESQNIKPTFWMKDMKFPIDIIWIDDGEVSEITENVPTALPETPEYKIPRYTSSETVDYVLEVQAGFAKRHDIQVGDSVEIPNI